MTTQDLWHKSYDRNFGIQLSILLFKLYLAVLHQHSWTTENKLLTASQGHLQASDIFLTFSEGLCEIFMTALIFCVALAVAGGAGANVVSIPHANVTHLTNRAPMQTTTQPPSPALPSQRHLCWWQQTIQTAVVPSSLGAKEKCRP